VDDDDAGEAILKLAKDNKSDLIVMGAFGRSRFREWILGGATRHVLENMTVPVFMAHQ
jgi:nucleotide-binding universal stress UspA family protein